MPILLTAKLVLVSNTCRSGPTADGAFALFYRPHPGGFDRSRVPTPVNLPSKAKKNVNARCLPGGGGAGAGGCWAQLELTDARDMKISSQVSLDQIGITMWGSQLAQLGYYEHNAD